MVVDALRKVWEPSSPVGVGLSSGESLLALVVAAEMPPLQADIFIDHVVLRRPALELAAEYGCARSNIGQVADRARRRARLVVGQRIAA